MSKTPIDEDRPEPGSDQTLGLEDESDIGFDWLLMKDRPVESPSPMDTSVVAVTIGEEFSVVDHAFSGKFTRSKVFEAASRGDPGPLSGLQDFLQLHHLKLTSPEYIDEGNGKTALLKALLNLNDGKNDTIQVLLDISEKTEDLKEFVNAAYNDKHFKGQTALHVAIERRSFDQVKLLVEKGADVQAKANGAFFQLNSKRGFYFGELPLSLAACTNQLEVVSFLMENQYRCADSRDHDSLGNTVLHALVIIADNTVENTEFIVRMYDEVLFRDTRLALKGEVSLEAIENKHGLTPLKLAAKMGKIGLFRYLVQREFTDEETKGLSRKFTDWIYGPIRSSLYDMTSIDTSEENSVLEIIVFGNAIKNRQEMLQVEPLHSLLEEKWQRFARRIFLVNFLVYVVYLGIFTTVALSRKEGQPPFPVENTPLDCFRCIGELVSVLGAVYFFIKGIVDFKRKPPRIKSMYNDGFNEISLGGPPRSSAKPFPDIREPKTNVQQHPLHGTGDVQVHHRHGKPGVHGPDGVHRGVLHPAHQLHHAHLHPAAQHAHRPDECHRGEGVPGEREHLETAEVSDHPGPGEITAPLPEEQAAIRHDEDPVFAHRKSDMLQGGGGKLEKMAVESGHLEGGRSRAGGEIGYLVDQPPTKTAYMEHESTLLHGSWQKIWKI
ncbi:transient receptor potential cation channel subfamily V member 1 isoform X2 [Gadus morhua]|uniref:transient receptor potential cation channel subfamily V member 1 isoform X2 n=1 Tax=Gadus morhua TaxID=8049 RepID=UPI0011B60312|nr:transient receptor potential cation channel subfamily V member 1-like isoform X2 [Gadus morhua]